MNPHARAVSVWYRIAGLISREQKTLAVEIIEAEVRSAHLLEAARLVLTGEPVEIARQLRDQAERTIRPHSRPQGTTPRLEGLTREEVGRVGRARYSMT